LFSLDRNLQRTSSYFYYLSILLPGVSTESNGTADAQMLCVGNLTNSDRKTDCAKDDHGGNNLYYALFILGMVIGGLGFSPLYALGVPYMDQNVKAKVSPMYLGIFVGFGGILGKCSLDVDCLLCIY